MKVNPSALIAAAVFYGLLWYAFERLDYGYLHALAVVALSIAAGWLTVGVIAQSPLGPVWPRRRGR